MKNIVGAAGRTFIDISGDEPEAVCAIALITTEQKFILDPAGQGMRPIQSAETHSLMANVAALRMLAQNFTAWADQAEKELGKGSGLILPPSVTNPGILAP